MLMKVTILLDNARSMLNISAVESTASRLRHLDRSRY